MTLWLRLIWLFLTANRRGSLSSPLDVSKIRLRVLPNDIDVSLHMNNGRYLTIMDLGRMDLVIRSGIWRAVFKQGWTPIANAITIRFRRELRTLAPYDLASRIVCWTETHLYIEQVFTFVKGPNAGDIAARAMVRAALYDRKARSYVPVSRLFEEVGHKAIESPPMPAEVEAFAASEEALRQPSSQGI